MKQRTSHAVVLGGGLAGMLAAKVLAEHVDRVTVVERDDLADDPLARAGLPQHRHAHLLPASGAHALEALLPGVVDALVHAGAHRLALPTDLLALTPSGRQRRFPGRRFALTCTRGLVDRQVRRRVFVEPDVELLDATEATGLLGGAGRVTGVRLRDRSGGTGALRADLVVDATGRGARTPGWLAAIGAPAPGEEVVDRGVVCASRAFTAPASARTGFPAVTIALDPRSGGRASLLTPVEDGRWLVTLVAAGGVGPPSDGAGFADFARALASPLVAELLAAAEPDGDVHLSRATANRRLRPERTPEGFLVLGDALSAVNPVHAHGMATAARSALALRDELRAHGLTAGAQRALTRAARPAWATATTLDRLGASPEGLNGLTRLRLALSRRLTAATRPPGADLPGSAAGLAHPSVLSALLRGAPPDGAGAAPPFTAEERATHPFLGANR
ncbi:NAD(P)/FAD-dependent oxidoreductase [Actinosynnema mirum]|uniref:Monooxygenase FAD-binding n=1 Tax=Actinosynnema mirum (strain ATCC 29888 / DSM 43827 / JCM 3225 / NBRC 14064 / NCIMB 13271 / NRRL B-12336 / IMRU 3971 / 101) TaxID=446462 RepID=C6WJZ6_ACTMD|nr:FAD-dependent monooxygenase [Actinosynnema mirum]ACU38209.1 monooxygenase FAD-binding [Actinosynnema mirum DSM 43827]